MLCHPGRLVTWKLFLCLSVKELPEQGSPQHTLSPTPSTTCNLGGTDPAAPTIHLGVTQHLSPMSSSSRLGGIPVGVITAETRTVEVMIPADPANLDSEAKVRDQEP